MVSERDRSEQFNFNLSDSFSLLIMTESKSVMEVMPIMSKITNHKLGDSNYFDWSKNIRLNLRSIDKDDHLRKEQLNEESDDKDDQVWLRDDARFYLQIRNSTNTNIIN